MAGGEAAELPVNGSLSNASIDRLACLLRHWSWADEAMARFEEQLAGGWEYDDEPVADHPFGAYYHWCALLCGLSEAALEHGLLSTLQLDAIRQDLEVVSLGCAHVASAGGDPGIAGGASAYRGSFPR